MNVEITAFYRDASNFKSAYNHIFKGPLDFADIKRMQMAIDSHLGFIPTAVGLRHAMIDDDARRNCDDMAWHDINCVRATKSEAQDERTFEQFVNELEKVDWDHAELEWEINNPVHSEADQSET